MNTRRNQTQGPDVQGNPPMPSIPPHAIPPKPVSALTPVLAPRGIIDYQSRSGERLYASATEQLDDTKYDGESNVLHQSLEMVEKRAMNFGLDKGSILIP